MVSAFLRTAERIGGRVRLPVVFIILCGCVEALPLEGASCPCTDGFHCCLDRCLPEGQGCDAIEVGVGSAYDAIFRPLPPGGRLELQSGVQGGYHVYVQIRTSGLDPERIQIERRLLDPETGALLRGPQSETVAMACAASEDEGCLLSQGQLLFVCPSLMEGEAMCNRNLDLEVIVHDAGGRSVRTVSAIHPFCPGRDEICAKNSETGCAAP